jgi:acetyl-CoA synthetase
MVSSDLVDSDAITGTQSLERAVALLREVASHGSRGARLTDLVADSRLSKATVRRLLAAMIRENLLDQDESTRRYYLGADIFVLGTIAAARYGVHNLEPKALSRLSALSHAKYVGDAIPLAALLCDRHKNAHRNLGIALVHESAAGHSSHLTYAELLDRARRLATVLRRLGISKGDRVATLLPKSPELLIAMVATWRLGAVIVPLFTAFGRPAVSHRLSDSGSKVVITNAAFRTNISDEVAPATKVILVEGDGANSADPTDVLFWSNLHSASPLDSLATFGQEDAFILMYTSSVIGRPKAIAVPVKALAGIEEHMRLGLDLRDDDIYWNLGDPGWAGGVYYAVVGPLLMGRSTIFCDGPFDAGQIYRVLLKHKVTNLAASPTWYDRMRASEKVQPVPAGLRLRVTSSVGDLLSSDLIKWVEERLLVRLHDHYGQAETGVVTSNHQALTLQHRQRPGSVGQAVPGFRVAILDADGREAPTGTSGEIAIDTEKSPLHWFTGYHNQSDATRERFRFGSRYYLTGDLGRMDGDRNVFYLGIKDDAIKGDDNSMVSVEVEDALREHSAVAKAAAIGKPDRVRGEIIKALVVLKRGLSPSSELAEEIAQHVRGRLGAHTLPPEIEFVARLPRSSKDRVHLRALRRPGRQEWA